MEDLLKLGVPWWTLIIRSLIIYIVFLAGLRLFGKREIGQFTMFDLVLILLVANALQPAITGPDTSLLGGVIIIITLLLINRGLAFASLRWPLVDRLVAPNPTVLARDGQWIDEAMRKEGVALHEGEMALREHGVEKVEDVRLAVLEEDGSISVVPKDAAVWRRRRRFRLRNR